MLFGQTPQDTRALFFSSWEKYRNKLPLEPLELQLVEVIRSHPEYHTMLEQNPAIWLENTDAFVGQTNPFLHMGLHLALKEQVATNRPFGIQGIYQTLLVKHQDPLLVEHLLMEPLAACLWQAQQNNQLPDEQVYLSECSKLIK